MTPSLAYARWQLIKGLVSALVSLVMVAAALRTGDRVAVIFLTVAAVFWGLTAVVNVQHWRFLMRWRREEGL